MRRFFFPTLPGASAIHHYLCDWPGSGRRSMSGPFSLALGDYRYDFECDEGGDKRTKVQIEQSSWVGTKVCNKVLVVKTSSLILNKARLNSCMDMCLKLLGIPINSRVSRFRSAFRQWARDALGSQWLLAQTCSQGRDTYNNTDDGWGAWYEMKGETVTAP